MCIAITPPLTVEQMVDSFDLEPLFSLIEKQRPYGCPSVNHVDDYAYDGKYRFVFDVTYWKGHEYDEDGASPIECRERVTLDVTLTTPLDSVVFLLIGNINALLED